MRRDSTRSVVRRVALSGAALVVAGSTALGLAVPASAAPAGPSVSSAGAVQSDDTGFVLDAWGSSLGLVHVTVAAREASGLAVGEVRIDGHRVDTLFVTPWDVRREYLVQTPGAHTVELVVDGAVVANATVTI